MNISGKASLLAVHIPPFVPSVPIATAYTNPKGRGDRRAVITATNSSGLFESGTISMIINGSLANEAWFADQPTAGKYLKFDFLEKYAIDEFTWIQNILSPHGTWKMQASQDDSNWVDIGPTFSIGTSPGTFALGPVYTAYRYWQLLGISGSISRLSYTVEVEFKISVANP